MLLYTFVKSVKVLQTGDEEQTWTLKKDGNGYLMPLACEALVVFQINTQPNEPPILKIALRFKNLKIRSKLNQVNVTFSDLQHGENKVWEVEEKDLEIGNNEIPLDTLRLDTPQGKEEKSFLFILSFSLGVSWVVESFPSDSEVNSSIRTFKSPNPNDVRIYFPREKKYLWANSAILKAFSPYFERILSAQAEAADRMAPSPQIKTEEDIKEEANLCDESDDEDDGKVHAALADVEEQCPCATPRYTFTVKCFRAITYLATFEASYSGSIEFVKLPTVQTNLNADEPAGNQSDFEDDLHGTIKLSPKSIYRLAHHLEIRWIQDKALYAFNDQLCIENAAEELYSKTSGSFSTIRKLALDYVCKNWKKVGASAGMKKVLKGMKGGGKLPHQEIIGAELLERLVEL